MTSNGLGWLKSDPITDNATVLDRLGYTETQMLNMTQQRNILDAARHCRLAHVRHSPTTSQVPTVLTDNKAAADLIVLTATKPLTAPPTGIGFGRPPPMTGLEILRRMHCVLGHCSLDQFHLLETLAKTKNMRVGVITRADVDAFRAEGCALCTIWLMRQTQLKI